MQLRTALAICLISLFSATLVVWIARALDMQAAARVQPQLAEIAAELRALRMQNEDRLVVYFFHRKERCDACLAIENQTKQVLDANFAEELKRGTIKWEPYDYELPIAAPLVKQFNVDPPIVVLAKMRGDRLLGHRVLGDVMSLHRDPPAFAEFMERQIREMAAPARATDATPIAEKPGAKKTSAPSPAKTEP